MNEILSEYYFKVIRDTQIVKNEYTFLCMLDKNVVDVIVSIYVF